VEWPEWYRFVGFIVVPAFVAVCRVAIFFSGLASLRT
jgi:hypothetical protein